MPKNPDEMAESMIANLKEKTGKTLDGWLKTSSLAKFSKHGELVKHLKAEHGVTHGYANLIAHKALKSDAGSSADTSSLVDDQYSGAKADLRPIYDALMSRVAKFGSDIEVAPKKAYVSLRRKNSLPSFNHQQKREWTSE